MVNSENLNKMWTSVYNNQYQYWGTDVGKCPIPIYDANKKGSSMNVRELFSQSLQVFY